MKTLQHSIFILLILFSKVSFAQQTHVVDVAIDIEECVLTSSTDLKNETLYPNPTNRFIQFNSNSHGMLFIFDQTGKQVMSQQISEGEEQIDIKTLEPGIYLVRIKQSGVLQTYKIIVE